MLWKYKKCYQETSEREPCGSINLLSVVEVIEGCFKLVSAHYDSVLLPPPTSSIQANLCGSVTIYSTTLLHNQTITINQCIDISTLEVDGVLQTLTPLIVSDAIANNGGFINIGIFDPITLDPIGGVNLIFSNCTTPEPILGQRSLTFVDGSNNDPLNLPQDPCLFTLQEFVYIFQTSNPLATLPIVGDIVCLSNNISNVVNGGGHWYKITFLINPSTDEATFVKIGTNGVVTQVSNVICA